MSKFNSSINYCFIMSVVKGEKLSGCAVAINVE